MNDAGEAARDRVRVCQVMECTIGGTRRHIGELCSGLAASDVGVTLVASAVRDPTFRDDLDRLRAAGVEVIELPMVREIRPAVDAAQQWFLARLFRRRRFDVIHTHSSKAGGLGRVGALLARTKTPVVHTPHTFAFTFTDQFGPRKRGLFLRIERFLGRRTARLVHVSLSERRDVAPFRIVPPERAVVIPNGIDAARYADVDGNLVRRELGLAGGAFLVGTVGLLNEAKGHVHLIDAARRVRERFPGVVIVIAGDGGLRGALERRIREAGLDGTVRLLGYRTDVDRILAALDLFVLPSLWEGLPYVVLEAMASGRPVIASDVNGARDLVADGVTGRLVRPAHPDALADAILQLLEDPASRERFARAGRERVRSDYSLERMIEQYVDLYRSIAPRAAKESP